MCYVIETGIPVPARIRPANNSAREPRTEIGRMLQTLEPDQSFLVDTEEEAKRAKGSFPRFPMRRFICRKVPRQGWRIWRVE